MKPVNAADMIRREMAEDPEMAARIEEEIQRLRIADKIRQLRKKAGLSQKELAKRINTGQSAISRLENSSYEPSTMNTLVKIAKALGYNLTIDFTPAVSNNNQGI